MNENTKSIYDYLANQLSNITDPEYRFCLPEEKTEDIAFADGAQDGIIVYHTWPKELPENTLNDLLELARLTEQGYEPALEKLKGLLAGNRAIVLIDPLLDLVAKNMPDLKFQAIAEFALGLITESEDREQVKIGMSLLELANDPPQAVKNVLRVLSLSDELTLYGVNGMAAAWENGNEEIFETAKHVHGWGRIHAVRTLKPETEEIRNWLLTEGVKNDVLPAYSALECYNKAEVFKRLQNKCTPKELEGIARIIEGLLDEGPLPGISLIEEKSEFFASFLTQIMEAGMTESHRDILEAVHAYAEKEQLSKPLHLSSLALGIAGE